MKPLPDHSSLTRIRQRFGIGDLPALLRAGRRSCQEAGLVWGKELYVDATKVQANADLDSLVPRFYHEATTHVAELFADERHAPTEEATAGAGGDLPAEVVRLPTCRRRGGHASGSATWRLLEERRLGPQPSGGRQLPADDRLPREPDRSRRHADADQGGAALGYHDHYVVDGGKARIILAALVTPPT